MTDMSIVAYSYLAALHCPHCTQRAMRDYRQQIMRPHSGPARPTSLACRTASISRPTWCALCSRPTGSRRAGVRRLVSGPSRRTDMTPINNKPTTTPLVERNRHPAGGHSTWCSGVCQVVDGFIRIVSLGYLQTRLTSTVTRKAAEIISSPAGKPRYRRRTAMTDRQTTHAQVCWVWGPKHYECAVRQIERDEDLMQQALEALEQIATDLPRGTYRPPGRHHRRPARATTKRSRDDPTPPSTTSANTTRAPPVGESCSHIWARTIPTRRWLTARSLNPTALMMRCGACVRSRSMRASGACTRSGAHVECSTC